MADGHQLVVLDDLSGGVSGNIAHHLAKHKIELVKSDFTDPQVLSSVLPRSEVVIHLAAKVSVAQSIADPESTWRVNSEGTVRLLGQCVKAGVKRFVFASSAAVYGNSRPPLKEGLPCNPLSPYASSKAVGEAYCSAYESSYGLETVVLRFMNAYGPRGRGGPYSGVMNRFAEAVQAGEPLTVYGDGRQTRDFVHVSDVVASVVSAMTNPAAKGEVFNIGSGIPTSIDSLASLFISASGREVQVHHGPPRKAEVRASYADISMARRVLGFSPKVPLAKGVREYLKWYEANRKGGQG